uniref:non-specific serine/threonine protein kinase n=1 Tax=Hippocampus comes TaxID=109280 RepID=A0A3Q2Y9E7_HIPCM
SRGGRDFTCLPMLNQQEAQGEGRTEKSSQASREANNLMGLGRVYRPRHPLESPPRDQGLFQTSLMPNYSWVKFGVLEPKSRVTKSISACVSVALFAEKYQQVNKLGEGGFGSVYAGYRKSDCFPVSLYNVFFTKKRKIGLNINGLKKDIPIEALLMLQASIKKNSDGKSAVVSLLNKYDLEHEIVLVMERPVPSVDLFTYITRCRIGALPECEAKNIMKQLVVAAINMHAVDVFHRDLKQENILLEATSGVPRVRIIDFGSIHFDFVYLCAGTLCYAPPEYVLRRTYSAGPTTVWHLGALLFELMAGTKRFDTVMFLSQMLRLNRVLSEDFLWKCLNLDPEKRATLEQMQQHPWLVDIHALCPCLPSESLVSLLH